jgi:hypothetical protein
VETRVAFGFPALFNHKRKVSKVNLVPYNFVRWLKILKGLTQYRFVCKYWAKEAQRFTSDPHHQTSEPNI